MIPKEGFGWCVLRSPLPLWRLTLFARRTNASYQVGLEYITPYQHRALGALTPPDVFFYGKRA